MGYSAKVLKDSVAVLFDKEHRLTTVEVTLPRIVLAELNTHRMLSRNSASSRAIPVEIQIQNVIEDPFIPIYWGKNQKGMQANVELSYDEQLSSKSEWLLARDNAVESARNILKIGVHKQITNRLLEPFMWQTVIITATDWDNFFALRLHKDAQPEIRHGALLIKEAMDASNPRYLSYKNKNDWHLPLIQPDEIVVDEKDPYLGMSPTYIGIENAKKISAGRCARISYLTHDGKRDYNADIALCDRLSESGHMSPLEHVAVPMSEQYVIENNINKDKPYVGNFCGWVQMRKFYLNEDNYGKINQ